MDAVALTATIEAHGKTGEPYHEFIVHPIIEAHGKTGEPCHEFIVHPITEET